MLSELVWVRLGLGRLQIEVSELGDFLTCLPSNVTAPE